jgi:tetratricopeptide (TPR) repeat protein
MALIASVLAPGVARAEDQDIAVCRTLCEHGAWEGAEDYADNMIGSGKPEGYIFKAWALAGRAAKENNPKLLDQAKKALADAKGKGARIPPGLDLEKLPPPKFGNGDFEVKFAWTLKNRGKIGAAEAVIDAAIAGAGLAPRDMAAAKMLRGDLYGDRSRIPELGNSDAAKRKEFFEKAKGLFLEVATAQGQAPELMIEARGHLYDLLASRGSGLLDAAKRADDLAVQDGLKKEALEAFKGGVEFLEKECKDLNDAIDKASAAPADPAATPKDGDQASTGKKPEEWCLIYANYYWPKCLVGQARATTDKSEHDSLVKKALDIYNDYNLRFGQEDQGFEAAIDMGEAYREINDEDNALVSLESALAIEKVHCPDYDPLHPPDPKKGLKFDQPGPLDVFARASLVKGKALKKKGDWKKALAAFDKVFADSKATGDPIEKEFMSGPLAKALLIERAEALARDGKMKEAKSDLEKIIKEDESGPTGQTARAMLGRLAGGGGGDDQSAGINADRALALMDEALGKGEFGQCTTWARIAIRKAKDEGKLEIIPKALLGLGSSYQEMGRYYESAIAYQEVTTRYRDSKVAADAAKGIVTCYAYLHYRTPSDHDKQKYEDALKFFSDNFPGQGNGFVDYLLGDQYREDGRLDDAAKSYDKVPPAGLDTYDKALVAASKCRYLLAQEKLKKKEDAKALLLDTAAALRKAIDTYSKSDGVTPDRQAKRKDLDVDARFLLANVLLEDVVNQPEEVLKLFENISFDSADSQSRAGLDRIQANLKLGRLDAAEAELGILIDKYKGQKRTILGCKDVGTALDRDVEAHKKDLSPEDRRKKRVHVARCYAHWILDAIQSGEAVPSLTDMRRTAFRMFEFALDVSNQPEDGGFISEVDDNFDPGDARQIFSDARDILAKLCEPDNLKNFKDAFALLSYEGECSAYIGDWAGCQKSLEAFVTETKLLNNGQLDLDVLQKNKALLAYYFDLGRCYEALGKSDKANYQKAVDVFTNVINTASEESRTWWKAKYEVYRCLDGRGESNDYKELTTAMHALERKYPDFKAAAKHGMQEKLQALKAALEAKGIK